MTMSLCSWNHGKLYFKKLLFLATLSLMLNRSISFSELCLNSGAHLSPHKVAWLILHLSASFLIYYVQQNSINLSKPEATKSSAFYVKGKFIKPFSSKSSSFGQVSRNTKPSFRSHSGKKWRGQKSTQLYPASSGKVGVICHYCGIPGHKAPDCRKKQRDLARNRQQQNNALSANKPAYIFSAVFDNSNISSFWYLDSEASHHMSPNKDLFCDYQLLDTPRIILLGDNSSHRALGYGSVLLQVPTGQTLLISDVLYVLGLAKNLIFVSLIANIGNTVITFTQTQCIILLIPSHPIHLYHKKFEFKKTAAYFHWV